MVGKSEKLRELNEKLEYYENKLAREMIGYRGVVHESSASEIKHDKVMVLKAMVQGLKEEIAKLAVEIARKILMRKIDDGEYEIESIVREAIENAPSRDGLVVKLNPQDLSALQKAQQDNNGEMLAGIKLVSDANISRAECIVESPKGVIESLIDGHLEQIGKALNKAE